MREHKPIEALRYTTTIMSSTMHASLLLHLYTIPITMILILTELVYCHGYEFWAFRRWYRCVARVVVFYGKTRGQKVSTNVSVKFDEINVNGRHWLYNENIVRVLSVYVYTFKALEVSIENKRDIECTPRGIHNRNKYILILILIIWWNDIILNSTLISKAVLNLNSMLCQILVLNVIYFTSDQSRNKN